MIIIKVLAKTFWENHPVKSITINLDHKKNDKSGPTPQHLGVYNNFALPDSSSWLPKSEVKKIHEDKYELGRFAFHKTEQIQHSKEESKQGKNFVKNIQFFLLLL